MILAVTSYGTKLRKRNGLLEITEKTGNVRSLPFRSVNEITLSAPCSLTSEVISFSPPQTAAAVPVPRERAADPGSAQPETGGL